MSNYQEGSGAYGEGAPGSGVPQQDPSASGGATGFPSNQQGGTSQFDTSQQFGTGGGQQNWQQPPQNWQGQGHQSQGLFQGGNPLGRSGGRNLQVRRTFKTTEFWVLVVVSIALLIAAAVTDQGADNQGFGAHDAWKYVTWLSIAYILSRGLTKFAGHERDRRNGHDDRH
jgi:hypothetical protein